MWCNELCENRGKDSQAMLGRLISNYPDSVKSIFQLKLAVLDSSQWTELNIPYGFTFISKGWIVIPGDLNFQRFSRLWGFQEFKNIMRSNFSELSNNPEELLTNSIYSYVICHELGHFYTRKILRAAEYDLWTSEWLASYFATDFLHKFNEELIIAYNVFTDTFSREFIPKYRTLSDFNELYGKVGLKNYIWYHTMFQPMIEDIYASYKTNFMKLFSERFPHDSDVKKMKSEEYLNILDKMTEGKTNKWIKILEGN
ncbi:MAG: hypothetical protein H6611_10510 [Ignavibacteriales bacterium]|nr:hypothetical protein [Ignavibacteriales bacterium]